jgi:hypothetical protein
MSLKLFFCQRINFRFLCFIVFYLLVKSLIYKSILKVLYYNKLSKYNRFKKSIIVVKIDIFLNISLLIIERELYILFKLISFKSKFNIYIKEVRYYFK